MSVTVTHRGNRRQPIFMEHQDRFFYLRALAEYLPGAGAELSGFCLMTNHVHLLVTPRSEDALARGSWSGALPDGILSPIYRVPDSPTVPGVGVSRFYLTGKP